MASQKFAFTEKGEMTPYTRKVTPSVLWDSMHIVHRFSVRITHRQHGVFIRSFLKSD